MTVASRWCYMYDSVGTHGPVHCFSNSHKNLVQNLGCLILGFWVSDQNLILAKLIWRDIHVITAAPPPTTNATSHPTRSDVSPGVPLQPDATDQFWLMDKPETTSRAPHATGRMHSHEHAVGQIWWQTQIKEDKTLLSCNCEYGTRASVVLRSRPD